MNPSTKLLEIFLKQESGFLLLSRDVLLRNDSGLLVITHPENAYKSVRVQRRKGDFDEPLLEEVGLSLERDHVHKVKLKDRPEVSSLQPSRKTKGQTGLVVL